MTREEFQTTVRDTLREIPHGCKLAIVGSTRLNGAMTREIIREVLTVVAPSVVISGGADGVDTLAQEEAAARGIATDIKRPKVNRWRDGFMPRNLLIAGSCDALVRIGLRVSETYGSGWTRDRAREMGKPTAEFLR